MIYGCSDVHGCLNEFEELLTMIEFSDNDTLYVLGDVIDRGPESIKCLLKIMSMPNVHMIMGNHEQMMLEFILGDGDSYTWLEYNGGHRTYEQFQSLSVSDKGNILTYLENLPYYRTVNIKSKKYLLVHAGLNCQQRKSGEHLATTIARNDPIEDFLWIRKEFYGYPALPSYTVLFGHTPVKYLHGKRQIWKDPVYKDKIGIDGGCVYRGHLCCLRLDDMREYYIKYRGW